MSKVATVEYLKSYFDEDVQLHNIYRYMDRLYNTQQEKIQKISVSHTLDVLRQDGFSKDGKTAESQIVLGLLVSEDGYPLSYSVFNGK